MNILPSSSALKMEAIYSSRHSCLSSKHNNPDHHGHLHWHETHKPRTVVYLSVESRKDMWFIDLAWGIRNLGEPGIVGVMMGMVCDKFFVIAMIEFYNQNSDHLSNCQLLKEDSEP
jgi:hypothetical protein